MVVVVVASESEYLLSKYMLTRKFEGLISIVIVCLLTGERSGAVPDQTRLGCERAVSVCQLSVHEQMRRIETVEANVSLAPARLCRTG